MRGPRGMPFHFLGNPLRGSLDTGNMAEDEEEEGSIHQFEFRAPSNTPEEHPSSVFG